MNFRLISINLSFNFYVEFSPVLACSCCGWAEHAKTESWQANVVDYVTVIIVGCIIELYAFPYSSVPHYSQDQTVVQGAKKK